ncbi:MAG: hypothetical protein L3J52_09185 [Proteobacteria bacterium]|nr:hypothetical protein [Pseudomonadota bacterium]
MKNNKTNTIFWLVLALIITQLSLTTLVFAESEPTIIFKPMNAGEVQPKLFHDSHDRVHMIYFKIQDMKTKMGNLFYRQYQLNGKWSNPIQVSSQSYRRPDVVATAELNADEEGRVHITWLRHRPTAFMYTRSNLEIEKFETERPLITKYLDDHPEASAVIAIKANQVSISWMAGIDESLRTVYNISSSDRGVNFGDENKVGDQSLGGCGCCSYASNYNKKGELMVAYRIATNRTGRHMSVLTSGNEDKTNSTQLIHKWEYNSCPVSSNTLVNDKQHNSWLAFETAGRLYLSNLQPPNAQPSMIREPQEDIRQKHPRMAFNAEGYKLVVWTEGDGYFSGGEVQIQLFDPQGNPKQTQSKKDLNPAMFSFAAVSSLPNGSFMVLY